jgi:hypothetical protein
MSLAAFACRTSVLRGAPNVDDSHETRPVGWCPYAAPLADEIPVIHDLHPRAGAPASQDDAVEVGRARRILPAPDERRERAVPVHDLIHRLESNDESVEARLSPENLCDERAQDTVTGEAFEETKERGRGNRRRRGPPTS